MREIKFRAWDKTRREFLSAGNIFIDLAGKVYLDIIERPDEYKSRFDIMQYTGIKDKNGKDVYENDIIKIACLREKYIVKFSPMLGRYFGEHTKQVEMWEEVDGGKIITVLGNVYKNPELLEKTS